MVRMNTDLGVQAAIEPWALVSVTVILVLPALAVEPAVASRVHRHADGDRARTAVVSIGAHVVRFKLLLGKVTVRVVVNEIWRVDEHILESRFHLVDSVRLVHDFIRVIKAVRNKIPTFEVGHTLPTVAGKSICTGRVSTELFIRLVLAVMPKVTDQRVGDVDLAIRTSILKDKIS
jgi:hypothetical protein